MKLFLGIDPGAISGAWGIVNHLGQYVSCGDIPNVQGKISVIEFKNQFYRSIFGSDFDIVIELVGSMPKQGLSSTYKFGRAVGAIEAVCELTGQLVTHVRPQKWKKEMELVADKKDSLIKARNFFPEAPLSRVKDHNKAEALLLARWLQIEWSK